MHTNTNVHIHTIKNPSQHCINKSIDKFIHSSVPYITIDSIKQLQDDIGINNLHILKDIMERFYPCIMITTLPYLLLSSQAHDNNYVLRFDSLYTLKYLSDNSNLNVTDTYINNLIHNNIQTFDYDEFNLFHNGYQYSIALTARYTHDDFELNLVDTLSRVSVITIRYSNSEIKRVYCSYFAHKRFNIDKECYFITIDKLPDDIKNHIQSYMTLLLLKKECNYV